MTSTFSPDWARAAATLTVVVVLPTPPFWFATVSTRVAGGCGKTAAGQGDPPAGVLRDGVWANGVSSSALGNGGGQLVAQSSVSRETTAASASGSAARRVHRCDVAAASERGSLRRDRASGDRCFT